MVKLTQLIKRLILITIQLIVLRGCRNDAVIKQQLQENDDKKNRSGNRAFSLKLSDWGDLPYTTKNMLLVSCQSDQEQYIRYRGKHIGLSNY